jgi:hypothetical protein
VTVMQQMETRPAIAGGRSWTIRRCQAGYAVTSTSDDYRRTVDDQGLDATLDGAQNRVEDMVGSGLRWSHSTLSQTWIAVEAR